MPAQSTMTERMIGAAKLDLDMYEEVEHDETATGQAAGVVAMVAVAQAVAGEGVGLALLGLVSAFVGWAVWAGVTYLIGDKLLGGTATWGELLRTLGFAQTPGLLVVLAVLPLGELIRVVVGVWVLVAGFIGLRQALDLGNLKTLFTAILGWLALVMVFVVPTIMIAGIGALVAN